MINELKKKQEIMWINPHLTSIDKALASIKDISPSIKEIEEAEQRLRRFAPFFASAFEDTKESHGLIESPLMSIEEFQKSVITFIGGRVLGHWLMKADSHLPISGSVKARGGIYEVITYAEECAIKAGLIPAPSPSDFLNESSNSTSSQAETATPDYTCFMTEPFKALFKTHELIVASTGNLGLSIGIIGSKLGFKVTVHMSHDAKAWKVEKLKTLGVNVILHESDYSEAVKIARSESLGQTNAYFIDDENSKLLFLGYAVGGWRLKKQLEEAQITVDETHPLFVYLPCGVGGAPGGISFALKCIFGDHVHIFIAEPTHAPCMLYALSSMDNVASKNGKPLRLASCPSISDIGIDGLTQADGLAVSRASTYVANIVTPLLSGGYTVEDDKLYRMLYLLAASQHIGLEPSALAGFMGPIKLFYETQGFNYLKDKGLLSHMEKATHISWATGGNLVPDSEMEAYIAKGQHSDLMTL